MTSRPTIITFLRARLDEDEQVARGAGGPRFAFPTWDVDPWYDGTGERADLRARVGGNLTNQGGLEVLIAKHAARWDPARVLAEVETKRQLLMLHSPAGLEEARESAGWLRSGADCKTCAEWGRTADDGHPEPVPFPCPTLRSLTLAYVAHADYDPAWAPEQATT